MAVKLSGVLPQKEMLNGVQHLHKVLSLDDAHDVEPVMAVVTLHRTKLIKTIDTDGEERVDVTMSITSLEAVSTKAPETKELQRWMADRREERTGLRELPFEESTPSAEKVKAAKKAHPTAKSVAKKAPAKKKATKVTNIAKARKAKAVKK